MNLPIILLITILADTVWASSFCQLPCNDEPNLGCNCTRAGSWCVDFDIGNLYQFRIWMVEIHNDLRSTLAQGRDSRVELDGGVANMHAINYDMELEHLAKCHSRKCSAFSDYCLRTSKFDKVGQNRFVSRQLLSTEQDAKSGVMRWYAEIEHIETEGMVDIIHRYAPFSRAQRFTQLAWAKTSHVGCWRTWDDQNNYLVLVCCYGVGGNVPRKRVLIKGKPCTHCGEEECNRKWPGLCGEVNMRDAHPSKLPRALFADTAVMVVGCKGTSLMMVVGLLLFVVKKSLWRADFQQNLIS